MMLMSVCRRISARDSKGPIMVSLGCGRLSLILRDIDAETSLT